MDRKRLEKELAVVKADKNTDITIELVDDNLSRLRGTISGPSGTPYEGGRFVVDIELSNNYPFTPPKMKFITKVYHPNISSQTGAICLDILKNEWSPALTIKTALLSLQALMCAPEPDDPQDAVVASLYKNNYNKFVETAKFWTESYAKVDSNKEPKINALLEMGFSRDSVVKALEANNWDQNAALDSLLSS